MTPIIQARGVSYRAAGRTLVNSVELTLEPGCLTVMIGPNGAGKSTLLRVLCGELAPSDGEVRLNGHAIRTFPAWRLAHARAVMPQTSELSLPFTVFEVARLGVEGLGRGLSPQDRNRLVEEALAEADVAHLWRRNYQTLSGGERQRVHFARVLAQLKAGRTVEERQVLFLDEPVASLDLKHQLAVMEQARRLVRGGLAVVAVLHDLQLASSVGDSLALMDNGRLVAYGQPHEVLTRERLRDVFGIHLTAPHVPPQPWRLLQESEA